ncbi:hypothetical protein B5S31_g5485 [[Candida] boidinii]|nr:hypothetical protein B5S29_g5285 [[Candida] boidinii]OWB75567.1 hypothetical protein B5S31_g5485 [[Candida] boidinii]OWB80982.1 hypothetical protein B5S32_g5317 [[Candida] boidinii]
MVSTASNVLATIGTVLWCIQLTPQIYYNYKKKNCEGLPALMLFFWSLCGVPFSIYFVSIESSIPVQIQPQCFTFLCLITFAQVLYYPPLSKSKRFIIFVVGGFLICAIGLEVGFIIPLRKLYIKHGVQWQHTVFGIIASVALAIGLLPPYFEAWKRKGRVIGINFFFLSMDLGGAIFSLISLAVDPEDIDVLGCIIYSICASLEIGIFLSHLIWCCRFKWFGKNKIQDSESNESSNESSSEEDNDDEIVNDNQEKKIDDIESQLNTVVKKLDNDGNCNNVIIDNDDESSTNSLDIERTRVQLDLPESSEIGIEALKSDDISPVKTVV